MLNGKFFTYLPEKSHGLKTVGLCMKCLPKHVEIRGHSSVNSNFKRHLKFVHGPQALEEYQLYAKGIKYENMEGILIKKHIYTDNSESRQWL